MKIKKFNELNETEIISSDTLDDIVTYLKSMLKEIDEQENKLEEINSILSSFRSKSKSSNTQIDDSYINIESVLDKIEDIKNLLDTTITNLNDYNDSGEKFIY